MNQMSFPFAAVETGRNLHLEEVRLGDADLAGCLAQPNPLEAARRLAQEAYAAANAATLAEAQARIELLQEDQSALRKLLNAQRALRTRFMRRIAKTECAPDDKYQQTRGERASVRVFTCLRYLLIASTVIMIGVYARGSGYSVDISTNWLLAIALGFPVLVASYAVSSVLDATDNVIAKRAIAVVISLLGLSLLATWAYTAASMFALQSAAQQAFSLNLAAPDPAATQSRLGGLAGLLFPGQDGARLFFTHVVADTLLAGAAGAWAKLAGKIGRVSIYPQRPEETAYLEAARVSANELAPLESTLAYLTGILAGYQAGLGYTVAAAEARIAGLVQRLRADQIAAHAALIDRLRTSD